MKTNVTTKDIARFYFNGLAEKVIKEGVQSEQITTELRDSEYNYLEEKILGYVEKHFNYAVVRNITQHIPTIATTVAAVLRVSTKATVITAVASTILELVIRAVIAYYMLPIKEVVEIENIDIDDEDDLFGDSFDDLDDLEGDEEFNFEEVEIEESKDESVEEIDPVVEEAVDVVVEQVMAPVAEEEIETSAGSDEDRENLGEPL